MSLWTREIDWSLENPQNQEYIPWYVPTKLILTVHLSRKHN
jgi:hypothetical protein